MGPDIWNYRSVALLLTGFDPVFPIPSLQLPYFRSHGYMCSMLAVLVCLLPLYGYSLGNVGPVKLGLRRAGEFVRLI